MQNAEDSEKIKIRKMKNEDLRRVFEIQRETWLDTYPSEEFGISKEDIEQKDFFGEDKLKNSENNLNDANCFYDVVEMNGEMVGYCISQKSEDSGEIMGIYILPKYQGIGIGKVLMKEMIEWLDDCTVITVELASYNEGAKNFYKKFGFRETNETSKHEFLEGKFIPTIIMER